MHRRHIRLHLRQLAACSEREDVRLSRRVVHVLIDNGTEPPCEARHATICRQRMRDTWWMRGQLLALIHGERARGRQYMYHPRRFGLQHGGQGACIGTIAHEWRM